MFGWAQKLLFVGSWDNHRLSSDDQRRAACPHRRQCWSNGKHDLSVLFTRRYCSVFVQDRLLKPLGGYNGYNAEWRELAEVVSRVNTNAHINSILIFISFFLKSFLFHLVSSLEFFHHKFSRTLRSLTILLITFCSLQSSYKHENKNNHSQEKKQKQKRRFSCTRKKWKTPDQMERKRRSTAYKTTRPRERDCAKNPWFLYEGERKIERKQDFIWKNKNRLLVKKDSFGLCRGLVFVCHHHHHSSCQVWQIDRSRERETLGDSEQEK